MYKILICDPLDETAMANLAEAKDIIYDAIYGQSEADLIKNIPKYNAVIVRSATTITGKVIDAGENLRAIGRAGSGLDNIDTVQAAKKGIKVFNTPGTNAAAVAELTVGLLFSLARKITEADVSMKNGQWAKKEFTGFEIDGKILGIIGGGTIGKMVAVKAFRLGMKIVVYNRSEVKIPEIEFEQVSLEKLLKRSDFVSVHLPKNPETAYLIGEQEFEKIKQGSYLINTSRGGIVSEAALLKALDSGILAGAALDVFENEPGYDKNLAAHKRVIASPHIGASTTEAQERVGLQIVDKILGHLRSNYIFISGQ
ncbi:MAG: hydroxyacid dehydrogenase [Calditrichaceae bacterium]